MKKKGRLIAVLIMLIFALHALFFGFRPENLAGVILGFLMLLFINFIKERPSPTILKMPERKPHPDI